VMSPNPSFSWGMMHLPPGTEDSHWLRDTCAWCLLAVQVLNSTFQAFPTCGHSILQDRPAFLGCSAVVEASQKSEGLCQGPMACSNLS
jgi:hypothetical protein